MFRAAKVLSEWVSEGARRKGKAEDLKDKERFGRKHVETRTDRTKPSIDFYIS